MKVLPLRDAYNFGAGRGLTREVNRIQSLLITWDRSYKSTVRRGEIIELFETRDILKDFIRMHWPEANSQSGQTYIVRCKRIAREFDEFNKEKGSLIPSKEEREPAVKSDIEEPAEFELESHLAEFIYNNWDKVFGSRLRIYKDEEGREGKEWDTKEIGKIDFLCQDDDNNFIVIELKKGRATDKVLGQIQRYMGWILQNLAQGRDVKGMIITPLGEDEQLRYALLVANKIEWKCYKLDFRLVSPEEV